MIMNLIIESITHLFGVDLFFGFDSPKRSCFDFEKKLHDGGVVEYFGVGLHLTVMPQKRIAKQSVGRSKIPKMK